MSKLNCIIELHDSEVEAITQIGERMMISFSAAYIHKSEGKPRIDPGNGWTQAAQLAFDEIYKV